MSSRNDILRMLGTGMTAARVAAQLKIPLKAVLAVAPHEAPKPKPKKKKGPPPPPVKVVEPPAEPAVPPAPKKRGPPKGVSRKTPEYVAECAKKGKVPKVGGNPKGASPEQLKPTQFQKGNPGSRLKKTHKGKDHSITASFRQYWAERTSDEDKTAVWTGLLMRARIGDDRAIKLMVDLNGESLEAEMKNKLIKDEGCRVVFTLPAKTDG